MKAVVAAFNQEKALVGAFSVITNLRICFGWNFLKHYLVVVGGGEAEQLGPLPVPEPGPGEGVDLHLHRHSVGGTPGGQAA